MAAISMVNEQNEVDPSFTWLTTAGLLRSSQYAHTQVWCAIVDALVMAAKFL